MLFDNPAYSAQASPDRASTADSGLRRLRQDADASEASLLLTSVLSCSYHSLVLVLKSAVENSQYELASCSLLSSRLCSALRLQQHDA